MDSTLTRLKQDVYIAVLSIACAVLCVIGLWPYLNGTMVYDEFVVGPSTLMDGDKAKDLPAAYAFIGLTCLAFVLIRLGARYVQGCGVSAERVSLLLLFLVLPLIPLVGSVCAAGVFIFPDIWIVSMALVVLGLPFLIANRDAVGQAINDDVMLKQIILGCVFSVFSGFAVLIVASLSFPGMIYRVGLLPRLLFLCPLFLFLCRLGLIFIIRNGDKLSLRLRSWFIGTQALLPLLFLSLWPVRLNDNHEWLSYEVSLFLAVPTLLVVCIHVVSLIRHRKAVWQQAWFVSGWSLASIAVFVSSGKPRIPALSNDAFHFGEQLLPWYSWSQFNKIPFVDFFPFHGWMHFVAGGINSVMYSGGVGTHHDAVQFICAISAAICAVLVYRMAGACLSLYVAVYFIPNSFYAGRFMLVMPALLLLSLPRLISAPMLWVLCWGGLSLFLGLYNTVSGGSFVLATLPVTLWMLLSIWRSQRRSVVYLCVASCIGVSVLAIPLIREILLGYIQFILENRPSYGVVQGRPWSDSFDSTPFSEGLLSLSVFYELARHGWALFLLLAIYGVYMAFVSKAKRVMDSGFFLSLSAVLFLVLTSSYALGRIDTNSAGRHGTLTYMLLVLWLPLILTLRFRIKVSHILPVLLFLSGFMTEVMSMHSRWSLQQLYWQSFRLAEVPPGYEQLPVADGVLEGAYLTTAQRAEIAQHSDDLHTVLNDDQTYWDLTSRQAFYVYVNRPVPITHGAIANIDNQRKQSVVLDQIATAPPPAVWLHPRLIYDVDINLRSYPLYRFALLNYEVVDLGNSIFMVNQASPAYQLRLDQNDKIRLLNQIFPQRSLKKLPTVWGLSWNHLQRSAEQIQALLVEHPSESNRSIVEFRMTPISGIAADLVVLELASDGQHGVARLVYRSEFGMCEDVEFMVSDGIVIVPVGAFPDWLLAQELSQIRLVLPENISLLSAALWQRHL